jgi:hypothetical protein
MPLLPSDSSLLSQRLLIDLAEALVRRRPDLDADVYATEAQRIGHDQVRLRRRVAEILFMRLGDEEGGEHAHGDEEEDDAAPMTPEALLAAAERATEEGMGEALDFHGDETPVVAVNRPLLEAYNAMWDAGRALAVGDPVTALPYMHAALSAIQRARAAERIYLRGRPAAVVVDLPQVRLSGSVPDEAPAGRSAGVPGVREVLAARVRAVVNQLIAGDPEVLDSLLTLRVSALATAPDVALALERAAEAVRAGGDPSAFVREAYARLGGSAAGTRAQELWSVVP